MEKPGFASYGTPSYGNASGHLNAAAPKSPFQHHRRHVSISVILLCLLIPVVLFAAVCAVLSFSVHHDSPGFTWFVVVLGALAVLAVSSLAATAARRRYWQGSSTREPYWYIFLSFTMLLAYIFAVDLGLTNWWTNMLPYQNLQKLSAHPDVDPSTMTGQQVMDVGRVVFTKGTTLDLTKSIGFKNAERYCVAPVTKSGRTLEAYDFWAIGLNCCSGNAGDFHCGDYANPNAHAGLRLMRDDQRAFYRLAVQQALATYNIRSEHPLFFYWMQDPLAEMESYRDDAAKYYFLGLGATFFCQLLLLVLAVLGHSKL